MLLKIDLQKLLKIGSQVLIKIGSTSITQNRSTNVTYDWFLKRYSYICAYVCICGCMYVCYVCMLCMDVTYVYALLFKLAQTLPKIDSQVLLIFSSTNVTQNLFN